MKHTQSYIKQHNSAPIKGMKFVTLLVLFAGGLFALYMAIVDAIAYTHLSTNSVVITKPRAVITNCAMVPLVGDLMPAPVVSIRFQNVLGSTSTLKVRTSWPDCGTAQRAVPLVVRSSNINPQLSMLEPDYRALPMRFVVIGMIGFGCLLYLAGSVIIRLLMARPKTYRVEAKMDQFPDEPQRTNEA